jgi:hypothetical protein
MIENTSFSDSKLEEGLSEEGGESEQILSFEENIIPQLQTVRQKLDELKTISLP